MGEVAVNLERVEMGIWSADKLNELLGVDKGILEMFV